MPSFLLPPSKPAAKTKTALRLLRPSAEQHKPDPAEALGLEQCQQTKIETQRHRGTERRTAFGGRAASRRQKSEELQEKVGRGFVTFEDKDSVPGNTSAFYFLVEGSINTLMFA